VMRGPDSAVTCCASTAGTGQDVEKIPMQEAKQIPAARAAELRQTRRRTFKTSLFIMTGKIGLVAARVKGGATAGRRLPLGFSL
jgi:hypothetical protein